MSVKYRKLTDESYIVEITESDNQVTFKHWSDKEPTTMPKEIFNQLFEKYEAGVGTVIMYGGRLA